VVPDFHGQSVGVRNFAVELEHFVKPGVGVIFYVLLGSVVFEVFGLKFKLGVGLTVGVSAVQLNGPEDLEPDFLLIIPVQFLH